MWETSTLERIYNSYIETALWSETDEEGNPLDDNYSEDDLTPSARQRAFEDILDFVNLLVREDIDWQAYGDEDMLGHDFWLTRNGHGAGFWGGDWSDIGDRLTELCKPYGECYAYCTDDGQIELL